MFNKTREQARTQASQLLSERERKLIDAAIAGHLPYAAQGVKVRPDLLHSQPVVHNLNEFVINQWQAILTRCESQGISDESLKIMSTDLAIIADYCDMK